MISQIEELFQKSTEVAFSTSPFKGASEYDYVVLGFDNNRDVTHGLKGYSKLLEYFKGHICELVIQPKVTDGMNIIIKSDRNDEFVLIKNLKYDPINLQMFSSHLPKIERFPLIIGINPASSNISALGNSPLFILSKYSISWL